MALLNGQPIHPPSPEATPLSEEKGEVRVLLRSRADQATAKQNVASERFRPTGVLKSDTGLPVELHFMGIGGIGMSGLASILRERGHAVHGCDVHSNQVQRLLQQRGVHVTIGHHPAHLTHDVGLLIYSAAVSAQEPELAEARARGIRTLSRGQLLAELAAQFRLVGVAGAHGKTTTSGMAAQLLMQAGWDPTVVVGGMMRTLGSNARAGRGRYLVAETDESDGSFLFLHPAVAIVTNIDHEHLNHYQTFDKLVDAFKQFQIFEQLALILQ